MFIGWKNLHSFIKLNLIRNTLLRKIQKSREIINNEKDWDTTSLSHNLSIHIIKRGTISIPLTNINDRLTWKFTSKGEF